MFQFCILISLSILLVKVAQVLSDWMETIEILPQIQTVTQIEFWALTGPFEHIQVLSSLFCVVVLLEGEHLPHSYGSCKWDQFFCWSCHVFSFHPFFLLKGIGNERIITAATLMHPSPCFIVGMVSLGWWAVLGFAQMHRFVPRPKKSNLDSSDKRTFFLTFACGKLQTEFHMACFSHLTHFVKCPEYCWFDWYPLYPVTSFANSNVQNWWYSFITKSWLIVFQYFILNLFWQLPGLKLWALPAPGVFTLWSCDTLNVHRWNSD